MTKESRDKFYLPARISGCWLIRKAHQELGSQPCCSDHSVWKWEPPGKSRALKQEAAPHQLLGTEAGDSLGPPGEAGTRKKPLEA